MRVTKTYSELDSTIVSTVCRDRVARVDRVDLVESVELIDGSFLALLAFGVGSLRVVRFLTGLIISSELVSSRKVRFIDFGAFAADFLPGVEIGISLLSGTIDGLSIATKLFRDLTFLNANFVPKSCNYLKQLSGLTFWQFCLEERSTLVKIDLVGIIKTFSIR